MTKSLIAFVGEEEEDKASLEVFACALDRHETDRIIEELKAHGFRFLVIETDSVRAKLTGKYSQVWNVMEMLRQNGWEWD